MDKQLRIAFVWQGISGCFGLWNDGLREAMRIIEKKHTVSYHEPTDDIVDVDVIMYWESPCTVNGPNKDNWLKVVNNPIKKVLLFSGGPIEPQWFDTFAHTFVESEINSDELESWGIPHSTAFGVNVDIFRPVYHETPRWDAMHHATSASWKRQPLLAEALKDRALIVGRFQPEDPFPFNESERLGATVLRELASPEAIAGFLNDSYTLGQTSNYWGGGQRATLEALACNVPVVCMKDSPKNCEYVRESGWGIMVDPDASHIIHAVDEIKTWDRFKPVGRDYILSKWTSQHYAENLLKGIYGVM